MHLSIHNRSLLRGMVAGAVALASASACSRSDRATAGQDTTQTGAVAPADTQAASSTQPNASTQTSPSTQPATDTTMGAPGSTTSADTTKATYHAGKAKSSGARAAAPTNPVAPSNADQGVAGYKAMGSDSSTASANGSDSAQISAAAAQPTDTSARSSDTTATDMAAVGSANSAAQGVADTSAATEVTSDTTNAGAAPMARDTSVALAQGDTAVQAGIDSSSQVQADTATIGDTGVILTQPDTSKTEVAVGNESDTTAADSGAVVHDSAAAERIHPDTVAQKAAELAKHEPARVRPPADSTADAAAVGAAGVASTGNIATGSEAVSQMTRAGESCSVTTTNEQWDMASSPATLNPCGTGTMTLPKIWTGEKK